MKRYLALILIIIFPSLLKSQTLPPDGFFQEDSVQIGAPFGFALSLTYNAQEQVLFPDSNYNFKPFDLIGKNYFPTKTLNGISKDCVVYILETFKTDSIQKLSLPVFYIRNGDSLKIYSQPDSVTIIQNIKTLAGQRLLSDTQYSSVKRTINYPLILGVAAIVFFFLFLFYMLFGKAIVRSYKLYVIRKAHLTFLRNFEKHEKEFKAENDPDIVERALNLWKIYLTRLENIPVNTYTTTEIIDLYKQEDLQQGLQDIDRAIYGGLVSAAPTRSLTILKKFTNKRFLEVKNKLSNV
ncbi:MAG: hypothetical protein J7604_11580 [Sporocytophaga sp.]|uniref:hypothetical protein n=1 Tax=Sporocytophaga sp. TaxID=2231183 RepID=UPI001B29F929|nr:hypothetical protein [Sporocytophaga sp.]MBO9700842.1 hypothetical protein [Sporocytophaga sp.]